MAEGSVWVAVTLLVTSLSLVTCDCPPQRTEVNGRCSLHVYCHRTIDRVKLPQECQGSPNYPVRVAVTLTNAIDKYDEDLLDPEFLDAIAALRVFGNLPNTSLSFIVDMHGLESLYLVGNKIEQVDGKPFFYLERLEEIDLSNNCLKEVSELFEFESVNRLKRLSLAHNQISDLPGFAFEELSSLVELDLSHNQLSDLTEEPFSNLTSLQFLRLNNNQIKNLNGAVNNLLKLTHLFLKGNQLQNIDAESLQIIYHLETFDVSENDLATLKPTVFLRHWLHFESVHDSTCKIILSGNHITTIPNATNQEMSQRFYRHLTESHEVDVSRNEVPHDVIVHTELDLSKNEIFDVEYNAFQTIVRLTALDLSNNKLKNFVINPKDLSDMKLLNLSSNYITTLSFMSFSPMTNLQNLDLSHNQLDFIPDHIFLNNYNLKYVNMTYNNFRVVVNNLHLRQFHPEGGTLDLSNNGLSQLYLPIDEAIRLTTLVLTSNRIDDAAHITLYHQRDLKSLYMNENHIHELNNNSLRLPVALASLDLTFNEISEIGDGTFRRVAHLQILRLSYNKLTRVTYGTFSGLRELKYLDLSNNKIHRLDSKVLLDLRFLQVLYLSFNEMYHLDYNGWLGHKFGLQVYLDGNNMTCDWLSGALSDYYNGYSRMRPSVIAQTTSTSTLDGIPCVSNDKVSENLVDARYGGTDDRLLINSQKILEAVREETYFLKKILRQGVQDERKQQ